MMRKLPFLLALLLAACSAPSATPTLTPAGTASLPPAPAFTFTLPPLPSETPTTSATAAPSLTPTLGIGASRVSLADGMALLYVPAGTFTMGYDGGYPDEAPAHSVSLPAFWVDSTEVTNAMYALCVAAGACTPPARFSSNAIDHYYNNPQYAAYPVIFVDWSQASAYCAWAGRALPTEAQWEKAARGVDGRLYPWGDAAPDPSLALYGNNIQDAVRVGSYPAGASPYGALDLAGNVWEWTADWYSLDYYGKSPAENPAGPAAGTLKVLRGGSWNFDTPGLRATYRLSKDPAFTRADVGFRCVLLEP